jgi:hypothetical protein
MEKAMEKKKKKKTRSRPPGVTILAVLLMAQCLYLFIVALFAFLATLAGGKTIVFGYSTSAVPVGSMISAYLFTGIFVIYFIWGLWTMRPWSFWATVILEGLNLLAGIPLLLQPQAVVGPIVVNMIFSAIILIYFFYPSVRTAFRT